MGETKERMSVGKMLILTGRSDYTRDSEVVGLCLVRVYLVMVMVALGTVDMSRFLGGRGELAREHYPAGVVLLGQVFRNLGVESLHVADHAIQETARLKILAGKFGQDCDSAVEYFRG